MSPYYKPYTPPPTVGPTGFEVDLNSLSEGAAASQAGGAPLSGSGSFDLGKGLTGVASLASLYGDFDALASRRLNLTQGVPTIGEVPSYSGAGYNEATLSKPSGAGVGEIFSGAGKGAAIGSALGPVGTAVGAVVGAGGTALAGLFGESEQEKQKREALSSQRAYQGQYNTAANNYQQNQDASADYRRRMDNHQRYANLYRTPSQYA